MDLSQAKRNIGISIVLSIVTCGIYGLYWLYKILSTLYMAANKPNKAATDLFLTIITCGIYGIYLMYKAGKIESEAWKNYDMPSKDDSTVYVILSVFGLLIVACAIIQSNINTLADKKGTTQIS